MELNKETNTFKIDNELIKKVIDWWNIPGTQNVFYNYEKGILDNTRKEIIRRNTIKGKVAEICEHTRLGVPLDFDQILRSDIKGDGGIDVIHGNKKIDVKTRNGNRFGFLISKRLFNNNIDVYFSGYTILYPEYNVEINKHLECMLYQYTGIIHSSDLFQLKNSLTEKFNGMLDVPAIHFKNRTQKQKSH